jgi:hypothetical protein
MAASTLACYDLGYRKVMGKTMLDMWISELEQSAKLSRDEIGLKDARGTRGHFCCSHKPATSNLPNNPVPLCH